MKMKMETSSKGIWIEPGFIMALQTWIFFFLTPPLAKGTKTHDNKRNSTGNVPLGDSQRPSGDACRPTEAKS